MGRRKMRPVDLARAIGKSESWMSGVLSGRTGIQFDVLDDLAGALKIEVADLFLDRDLSRQGQLLQRGLHRLPSKGAPDVPAVRVQFSPEIIEAYYAITAYLFDRAVADVESETPALEPPPPSEPPRALPPHRPRARRVGPTKKKEKT
jgi:transcriptional regulator with XRE-family HTH domain